ncbi:MAG: ribulose-phosphate 3-epimerase [Bacteriovoracaceae bacterium]|nr:ribulose-phosphate 3-epimerase [Bacteriovoracaceae bacterium]
MSVIISPSLLSVDFLELKTEIERLNQIDDLWLHLDIMDAHFVPNLTFGEPVLNKLKTISKHKLDAHFMVTNPDLFADSFKDVGLHNFTFHWEAVTHHDRLIDKLKSMYPSVGISLNPSTPINVIPPYLLGKIDLVLLMSVNPGFGGQKFIPEIVDKVIELDQLRHAHGFNFQIQVDGGINDQNAGYLIQAGANNLVAGSYIFSAPNKDYLSRINKIR